MRIKVISILIILMSFGSYISAQRCISGKVVDKTQLPLEGVSVIILNHSDSSYVSGVQTDSEGFFSIQDTNSGEYIISLSMIGFRKVYIPQLLGDSQIKLNNIILEEDTHMLSAITVTGEQPSIKVEPGKTIVNLSSALLNSDGNILEALRKLPGVIVQNDGKIILNGKTGANLLIDDRVTYLSGENLINYLRSIPASSVENVELISQPSSKYDAAGTSGIINIRKKRVTEQGLNMRASSGLERGKYTRGNENLSFSFRYKKINIYANYSFYWGKDLVDVISSRQYTDTIDFVPSELRQSMEANRKMQYRSHYMRTGMDYDLSDRIVVGTYFSSNWFNRNKNELSVTDFYNNSETQSDSTLAARSELDFHYENLTGGANITYKYKDKIKWDASFDYQLFDQGDDQIQKSDFRSEVSQLKADTLSGKTDGDIRIYSAQTNLSYILSDRLKFSTGLKSVFVDIDNIALYENLINGNWQQDIRLGSSFDYKENINAGYIQLNTTWTSRLSSEIGIRLENTNIDTHFRSNNNDSVFSESYTDVFPSLMLQYILSDNHSLSVLYGRRINRPNYRDLNPFVEVRDRFLHEKGNTDLKPELIDNFELSWLIKKQYSLNLFYSNRERPITKSYLMDENKRILVMPLNLSRNHSVGLRLGLNNIRAFNWWKFHLNSSLIYKQFRWMMQNKVEENKNITPMVHLNNQFSLPYGWNIEAVGYYNGSMAEGQAKIHPLWSVSLGIRKNFLNNKISMYIYANDIFKSNSPHIDLYGNSLDGWYEERYDSRMIGISLSYQLNWGKGAKESKRDNRIDESKRISM